MEYLGLIDVKVENLRAFLLGKKNYEDWKNIEKSFNDEYVVIYESKSLKKMRDFALGVVRNEKKVGEGLEHEKKHIKINERFGFDSKIVLKKYSRRGKDRFRFAILNANGDDWMKNVSKKEIWDYFYGQTSMKDASDSDKMINLMLKEIKEDVFCEFC